MNDEQQRVIGLLNLPDRVYLTADSEHELDAIRDQLEPDFDAAEGDTIAPILAIGVVSNINLDQYQHIPGLLATRYQGLREWQVDFEQNLRFIVTDLRTGEVQTMRSFAQDKRMAAIAPSGSGPEPDEVNRNAVTYDVERFNVPSVFNNPWYSPRIAVAIVQYDWLSNSVIVDIDGQDRIRHQPNPGHMSNFLSSTDANPASAQLAEEGIALALPARASMDAAIEVHAALRLWRKDVVLIPEVETRSALLRASLLLIALDADDPVQFDLLVPVTTRKVTEERLVEGSFSFDLRTALVEEGAQEEEATQEEEAEEEEEEETEAEEEETESLASGLYQAYLVIGAHITGPYPMTIE